MCVSCNSLSLHTSFSASVGNFLVSKDAVPPLENVLLSSGGDVGANEEGIAGSGSLPDRVL
jgi:hypothetical protein